MEKNQKMPEGNPPSISPSTVLESQEILERKSHGNYVGVIGAGNLEYTRYLSERVGDETEIIASDIKLPPGSSYGDVGDNVHQIQSISADYLEEGVLDEVYALNVIQDTRDPSEFLRSLEESTRSEGTIVISFPDEVWRDDWPDESTVKMTNSEFDKLSVGVKGKPVNFEQYFIPGSWIEDQADELGLSVEEEGRVEVNDAAIPVIEQLAEDPEELPDAEDQLPGVKYYVLKNNN